MDMRSKERHDDLPNVETPEDVAVLYSWANLHGAKYRDFSASRREYRAQLRHRAAEQARELELRAHATAETSADIAEKAARQAEEVAMSDKAQESEYSRHLAQRDAEETARVAAAERIEVTRRAEAANLAEAAAQREEREIVEASASARRQAARYADSELRRKYEVANQAEPELPGEISDPYTPQTVTPPRPAPSSQPAPTAALAQAFPPRNVLSQQPQGTASRARTEAAPATVPQLPAHPLPAAPNPVDAGTIEYATRSQPEARPARRPQGYRPDDASGVRQIYRGPEFETPRVLTGETPSRPAPPPPERAQPAAPTASQTAAPTASQTAAQTASPLARPSESTVDSSTLDADHNLPPVPTRDRASLPPAAPRTEQRASAWSDSVASAGRPDPATPAARQPAPASAAPSFPAMYTSSRAAPEPRTATPTPALTSSQPAAEPGSPAATPRRRRQDSPGYKQEHPSDSNPSRRRDDGSPFRALRQQPAAPPAPRQQEESLPPLAPELTGPAWLYATVPDLQPKQDPPPATPQSSVADTLQHSRERVASRWYALKGVFEQPGHEQAEPAPVRQKETRTPILAVFSMAGGVGKTSLVATLGRSLSSLGEKVLLTDTTSHGLLPFYFGASELRQGTVRTFSPPSGSTDAPIYLVSYDVDQKSSDEAAQDALVDEITGSSRGTHRVLLDLTVSSGWIVRRMARLSPTVLVPVSPDMNSVISLQAVERYFEGVVDADGRSLKLFYLLNQFDASLPLHLDIREVLRRQLGDRLLPFVIRRAPAVGEALAEGMTIVDYSPEAPVAEDYLNAATWLRTVAAPATAGFRNVRWSER